LLRRGEHPPRNNGKAFLRQVLVKSCSFQGIDQFESLLENMMTSKTPVVISATLTVVILILLGGLFLLLQMVALNGASERQGATALGIALACQSIVIILLGIFAAGATKFLITKVDWDHILAVAMTVLVATTIGGTISFLASVLAIPVAGIR
jgi:uncharacterized membrane protein YjgN (DUF898 family)